MEAKSVAGANDCYGGADQGEGYLFFRFPEKEHAEATLSIEGVEGVETATGLSGDYKTECLASMTRIIKVPVEGRTTFFTPKATVYAKGYLDDNRFTPATSGETFNTTGNPGEANVYASYEATLDSRTLSISRSGAPTSKKATDPTLDKTKDEWVEADGTGHGHTTHSYLRIHPLNFVLPMKDMPIPGYDQSWVATNTQTFSAVAPNWSNPTYVWSGSGLTPLAQGHIFGSSATADIPLGTKVKVDTFGGFWVGPHQSPKPYSVTSEATDSDGAKATATYHLTAHDEFENFRADPNVPTESREATFPAGPGPHNFWSAPVKDDPENVVGTCTWVNTITGSVELSGEIGGTATGSIVIASASLNWSAGVAVGISVGTELGVEAPVHGGKMRYPQVTVGWQRKNYLYDQYAPSGCVKNSSRVDGSWEFWFDDPTTMTPPIPSWSIEYDFGNYYGQTPPPPGGQR